MKSSGIAKASFIISIVGGVLLFINIVIAGIAEESSPGGIDEDSAFAMAIGCFIFVLGFLELIALGLGIAGLFQRDTAKVFAILGTIISSTAILGTLFLMLLGLAMDS